MERKSIQVHVFSDALGKYLGQFRKQMMAFDEDAIYINLHNSKIENPGVLNCNSVISELVDAVLRIDKIDRIFFHPFNDFHCDLLKKLKYNFPKLVALWVVWSKEIHVNRVSELSLYRPFSKQYVNKKYGNSFWLKRVAKNTFKPLYYKLFPSKDLWRTYLNGIRDLDFICCPFIEEYNDIIKIAPTKAEFLPFTYNNLDSISEGNTEVKPQRTSILVNHSSYPNLNHFEVLKMLNEIQIKEPVILPLAYGDFNYGKKLMAAIEPFNLQLEVQQKFMDELDYKLVLQRVKCAFFNIDIQQALGNVFTLMWFGAKIFLSSLSPTYRALKRQQFHIFSISDELELKDLEGLTENQINENRLKLKKLIGKEAINRQYKSLLTESIER